MKSNPFLLNVKDEENSGQSIILSPICKSDIWEAMQESANHKTVTVSKTSAQIKEQINNVLMPKLLEQMKTAETELQALLAVTGPAPTRDVRCYKIKLDNFPYKEYDYCEANFDPHYLDGDFEAGDGEKSVENISIFNQFTPSKGEVMESSEDFEEENFVNYPIDEKEAQNRQKYNDKVREVVEITVDLKTLTALLQIKDGQTFDLTVNQIIALGF